MTIKEHIAWIPDDWDFNDNLVDDLPNVITVKDLKALANSHTRLLEAAKGVRNTTCDKHCGCRNHAEALGASIEEAERL